MVYISPTLITLIIVGVIAIAVFYTLFSMQFKWDRNEQIYKELKYKQSKEEAAGL
jgi:type II secretory pathway pseudopilin PulG